MSLLASLLSALVLIAPGADAGSAATPQLTQPTTASAPAPSADDQTVVCKSIAVTGTRFPTRQCNTKAEWAKITAAGRDFTNKITTGPCSGSGCKGN